MLMFDKQTNRHRGEYFKMQAIFILDLKSLLLLQHKYKSRDTGRQRTIQTQVRGSIYLLTFNSFCVQLTSKNTLCRCLSDPNVI